MLRQLLIVALGLASCTALRQKEDTGQRSDGADTGTSEGQEAQSGATLVVPDGAIKSASENPTIIIDDGATIATEANCAYLNLPHVEIAGAAYVLSSAAEDLQIVRPLTLVMPIEHSVPSLTSFAKDREHLLVIYLTEGENGKQFIGVVPHSLLQFPDDGHVAIEVVALGTYQAAFWSGPNGTDDATRIEYRQWSLPSFGGGRVGGEFRAELVPFTDIGNCYMQVTDDKDKLSTLSTIRDQNGNQIRVETPIGVNTFAEFFPDQPATYFVRFRCDTTDEEPLGYSRWSGSVDLNPYPVDTWRSMSGQGVPWQHQRSYLTLWDQIREELLVFNFTTSSVRYRPSTDTWYPVAEDGEPVGVYNLSAVWTGESALVWGGLLGDAQTRVNTGAVYHPPEAGDGLGNWVALPESPLVPTAYHAAVWTGRELIIFGGSGAEDVPTSQGARFNPETGTWRLLPPLVPDEASQIAERSGPTACWTGKRMVIWGGANYDYVGYDSQIHHGAIFDPDGNEGLGTWTWLVRPSGFGPDSNYGASACAGTRLFVFPDTGSTVVYAYNDAEVDGAHRWTSWDLDDFSAVVASVPGLDTATARIKVQKDRMQPLWTGGDLLVVGATIEDGGEYLYPDLAVRHVRFSLGTGRWTLMSDPPSGYNYSPSYRATWTTVGAIFWGGAPTDSGVEPTGGIYTP